MLFFGCRHPEQDFIYADELREHADAGIVDLHVAFSRHDGKKTYVQDLLKEQADRVRALIEQGAIVYVCGDGGRMEPDVKRALVAICDEACVAKPRGRQSLRARRVGGQLSLLRTATPSAPATCAASSLRRRRCWSSRRRCSSWRGTTSRGTGRGATSRPSPRRRRWAGSPTGTPSSRCSAGRSACRSRTPRSFRATTCASPTRWASSSRPISWRPSRSRRGCARSISPPSWPTGWPIANAPPRWRTSCCGCCRRPWAPSTSPA